MPVPVYDAEETLWRAFCWKPGDEGRRTCPRTCLVDRPFIHSGYRYASTGTVVIRKKWKGENTKPVKHPERGFYEFPGKAMENYFREHDVVGMHLFPKTVPRVRSDNVEKDQKLKRHHAIQLEGSLISELLLRLIAKLKNPRYDSPKTQIDPVHFRADDGIEGIVMPMTPMKDW